MITVEMVARAMHEAAWRTQTTEPPAWERCADWIREDYRRDAQECLNRYAAETQSNNSPITPDSSISPGSKPGAGD